LIESLGPACRFKAEAFEVPIMLGFGSMLGSAKEDARSDDRNCHGFGIACGHEPSEEMKHKYAGEPHSQSRARLLPGDRLESETRERRYRCGKPSHQQQNQTPRWKQAKEQR